MKKRVILPLSFGIILSGISSVHAGDFTLFAAGVDPNDPASYYNADQMQTPTCWAAAGSNVVAHWQDHHVDSVPAGTPTGTDVYTSFLSLYSAPAGGKSDKFYQWWLGYYPTEYFEGTLKDNWQSLNIGGYYKDVYTYDEAMDTAWYHYTGNSDYSARYASRAIYYALSNGYSFAIGIPSLAHAFTVYGASFNPETELVTSLYLCDSGYVVFPKDTMHRARVNLNGNKLYIAGIYKEDDELIGSHTSRVIDNIYFLGNTETDTMNFVWSGEAIPEPSAFGLLAGVGALVLVGTRRRRRPQ